MLTITNTEVLGFDHAIRGMRNPMNSHDKSDSYWTHVCDYETLNTANFQFFVGDADEKLMKQLAKSGSDHAKYLRMITVYCDITAPEYWWPQFDSYKVGVVRNSCSKMHRLLAKPFSVNDFSFDQMPGYRRVVDQFRPPVDENEETWLPVRDGYEVSDCGRIRHGKTILSGSLHRDGYIFSTIKGKQIPLHRLIAEAFIQNPDNLPEVNHKDGNKQNNFVGNLEWVTRRENVLHSVRNHLQPRKVHTYQGKFTQEERNEIKRLADSGISRRKLAERFGVSHTCISGIINRKFQYSERTNVFAEVALPLVDTLNELRDSWLACEDEEEKKNIWHSILELLPISYNQTATVMLNYEVLRRIYHARRNHKLDEWHTFCEWIESLPHSDLITGEESGE